MKILYFKIKNNSFCNKVDQVLTSLVNKKEFENVNIDVIICSKKDALKDKLKVNVVPTFIKVSGTKKPKEIARIAGVSVIADLEKFLKT